MGWHRAGGPQAGGPQAGGPRAGGPGGPLREGLIAGLVATTAMDASYAAERQLRRNVTGPLDYDDSDVPVLAAARLLRRTDLSPAASRALGFLVHWGYGSLVGVAAVPLCRRCRPVAATTGYWAGLMVMACVLFPALGDTPPPWRWRGDVIATSAAQHLVYAASATATLGVLARRRPAQGSETGAV